MFAENCIVRGIIVMKSEYKIVVDKLEKRRSLGKHGQSVKPRINRILNNLSER
jgi:hypothetical protein